MASNRSEARFPSAVVPRIRRDRRQGILISKLEGRLPETISPRIDRRDSTNDDTRRSRSLLQLGRVDRGDVGSLTELAGARTLDRILLDAVSVVAVLLHESSGQSCQCGT
jgi:hypothetical protein